MRTPCTGGFGMRTGRATLLVLAAASMTSVIAPAARAQVSVELPVAFGVRIPSYDRINGLSLPFGPDISVDEDRLVVTPLATYRSNLGKIDPALAIVGQFTDDSAFGIAATAQRGTFTNDGWIRSDLINSLVTFGLGHDSRNYFRGDRAEARLTSRLRVPWDVAQVFVGARTERDWSTGHRILVTPPHPGSFPQFGPPPPEPASAGLRGPFSILQRNDSINGTFRPNPEIDAGHITSAIVGGRIGFTSEPASLGLSVLLEAGRHTGLDRAFQQLTIDEQGSIATFAGQHFVLGGHLVTSRVNSVPASNTPGGIIPDYNPGAPRQRYVYVGGSGSLATVDLLSLGGDHLYFVDTRYVIPIPRVDLPIVGQPYIAPRFAAGAAAIGGYGRPVQNVGIRIGASFFTADYVVNPRTHQKDYGVGLSLTL